jgi:DNA (cytosine-5)-methyltransferase 1
MIRPKAISLFSGAGGCSLGFKNAGFDVLYASDIDKDAIKSYRANFPNTVAEEADIQSLDGFEILSKFEMKQGDIDFLIGGPPCQGFSTAGSRFWDDPRNTLLKDYVRVLGELRPKWFLMENVEGLLTSKNGEYVFEAVKAFVELGYKVRVDKVYAHEFGVPQRRKRVFIIGNRLGIDFDLPKPTTKVRGQIFNLSEVCLKDALINLPNPSQDKNEELTYPTNLEQGVLSSYYLNPKNIIHDHYVIQLNELQLKRISRLEPGQTMKDLPSNLQHESFKRRSLRRVQDGMPSEKRGGAPSGLKRLFVNQPSLTITSAATREFIHPTEDRPLTIRECARIQTFPDWFEFSGNSSEKIQQIGNAIPPLLAEQFGLHFLKHFSFEAHEAKEEGALIGFTLTKAEAMSPALFATSVLLNSFDKYTHRQQVLF